MSVAPLIASGIGILLLIVTAYVLVGGTLTTTEVMIEAQTNLARYQEARMRTAIEIQETAIEGNILRIDVKNSGSEPIVDIALIDVYILINGAPVYIPYGGEGSLQWRNAGIDPDHIHPGELDPDETLIIEVIHEEDPVWVQVVTPNGVSSSAYIR
ncbi:MAG: flagellar protein FlaF [Methanomicrobiales archaeon]|nr:flagellar protein FlaF [Methanomicrobiales archaeon]